MTAFFHCIKDWKKMAAWITANATMLAIPIMTKNKNNEQNYN